MWGPVPTWDAGWAEVRHLSPLQAASGGSSGAHHHPAGWPVSWALGRGLGRGLAESVGWCPALGATGTQESTCLGFVGGRPPFPHDLRYAGDAAKAWNLPLSFQCGFMGERQGSSAQKGRSACSPRIAVSQPTLHAPHPFTCPMCLGKAAPSCPLTPALSPRGTCPDFVLTVSEEAWT